MISLTLSPEQGRFTHKLAGTKQKLAKCYPKDKRVQMFR